MIGPASTGDFLGPWRLTKRMDMRSAGQSAEFEGEATFWAQNEQVVYSEVGHLTFGRGVPLKAERTYLWVDAAPGKIDAFFEDGRPFHSICLGAEANADHFCHPDTYRVTYFFGEWPMWSCKWDVTGPSKDYLMVARYSRF